jgi:hypothetical protein
LVARHTGGVEVAGSNPVAPTLNRLMAPAFAGAIGVYGRSRGDPDARVKCSTQVRTCRLNIFCPACPEGGGPGTTACPQFFGAGRPSSAALATAVCNRQRATVPLPEQLRNALRVQRSSRQCWALCTARGNDLLHAVVNIADGRCSFADVLSANRVRCQTRNVHQSERSNCELVFACGAGLNHAAR